jgi:hypothetical protein
MRGSCDEFIHDLSGRHRFQPLRSRDTRNTITLLIGRSAPGDASSGDSRSDSREDQKTAGFVVNQRDRRPLY